MASLGSFDSQLEVLDISGEQLASAQIDGDADFGPLWTLRAVEGELAVIEGTGNRLHVLDTESLAQMEQRSTRLPSPVSCSESRVFEAGMLYCALDRLGVYSLGF